LSFRESVVEDAALEWLQGLGWSVLHGPDIAPGTSAAERDDYDEVVLLARLSDAVTRLNPAASLTAREEAIRQITHLGAPSTMLANRDFHKLLVEGVPVEVMRDGEPRGERIRVVDWDEPANNDWLAVNQFTIMGKD
jgi:type I restriction enzyme R subunit